jgi:hypothetical protein
MTARIEAPPRPAASSSTNLGKAVETVNGREIRKYLNAAGRVIYAVGRVGFYHLDEARLYAKGCDDPPPAH